MNWKSGLAAAGVIGGAVLVGWAFPGTGEGAHAPGRGAAPTGSPIRSEVVIRNCAACHRVEEDGTMSRISHLRKTPEGWQASLQRMVALQGVRLEPETAREIVRYLSNEQGLAPDELRPALFEVERRSVDFRYPEENVNETCAACHSMGMAMTQRRTAEEWRLLMETHRGYYPRIDGQRFRRGGGSPDGFAVDRAVEHLVEHYPFETAEWAEWSASHSSPRLEGRWVLEGWHPGQGPIYGQVEIDAVPGAEDEFTTRASYTYPGEGRTVTREGRSLVYTGFQWRGRSGDEVTGGDELREVMFVERDWRTIHGRWFTGAHDELGLDVRFRRVDSEPVLAGIHPASLRTDAGEVEVEIYGDNLPGVMQLSQLDLGRGLAVEEVLDARSDRIRVRVRVDPEARVGTRDVRVAGATLARGLVLFDRVDYIRVEPRAGMARIGGIATPKQVQQFEAIGFHAGPDGEAGTDDDLRIGPVPVSWDLLEYPVTFEDDDVHFVGEIDEAGLFTPGPDGLNPERAGDRNNMGDVWVRARYIAADGVEPSLEARAYLVVTAPVYMRWDAWTLDGELVP